MKKLLVLSAALLCSFAASAADISFAVGGEEATKYTIAEEFAEHRLGHTNFAIVPEVGVSYWHQYGHAWQIAASPQFRYNFGPRFYAELGVGVSYFNRADFVDPSLNTHFQFADQIGMGWHLASGNQIGVRYEHFSNADIRTPNPGTQAAQLVYTVRFK